MTELHCRFCSAPLRATFVDLGMSPLANSYLEPSDLLAAEVFHPLHTRVCESCWLVQLPEVASPESIFRDYAYFSSYSDSWLEHCRAFCSRAVERLGLDASSHVVELASNDGYLLRYFRDREIPVLGVEPARNVAAVAEESGIPTLVEFFGTELAERIARDRRPADLVVANNVLAHTPTLNDFVAGLPRILAARGAVSLEFPHLEKLIDGNQFDTIYHEHFSYFSFTTVRRVLEEHGLSAFDVEELGTHGGSLRVWADRVGDGSRSPEPSVDALLRREADRGFSTLRPYREFAERVRATKRGLLRFLMDARERGERVVGYGAPAKGNTLLNYCGVREDLLEYTVDRSPHKQGRHLPGVRVPIHAPERILEDRPDWVLILPWNLRDEIREQMRDVESGGGRFVVAVPELEILG